MDRIKPERLADLGLPDDDARFPRMTEHGVINYLRAEREYAERECVWDIDEDMTMHLPGCGGASGLDVNYMKFCPYCGGKIVEKEDE